MPKSIVVLCDGTSNTVEPDLSNVGKLYRCLVKDETQRVFYNPGVGTIADGWWSFRLRKMRAVFDQATGYGMDSDIRAAYTFICQEFEPGDQVYLFGFSRGAYTARIVAALIYKVGIFDPRQTNLIGHVLQVYKQTSMKSELTDDDFANISLYQKFAQTELAPIRFLGVWDTVSSLLVPGRNAFGVLPGWATLINTAKNRSVEVVRHAMAIDERRAMFRANHWTENQDYVADPFKPNGKKPQDVKQVWFAGVHADIGGGYPEKESGLAKIPLDWMIREAEAHGLKVSPQWRQRIVLGENRFPKDDFIGPSAVANAHESLKGVWWAAELLCKRKWNRDTGKVSGIYWKLGEPRRVEGPDPLPRIHESVLKRRDATGYWPPNLPTDPNSFTVET